MAEGPEVAAQARIELQRDTGPGIVLMRRPWTVSGQGQQYRRTRQCLLPVIALMAQPFGVQPVTLPHCVIAILQRQRRKRIILALTERLIERGEFTGQNTQRPAIGNDVVYGQQQNVTVFSQAQQATTNRQVAVQIEGLRCLFLNYRL
ncbi:hypothetical protein Pta6605_28990 [Pseudomonas amygdali pv. tabaci]|nr:hypothetical protein Pta6605_28990 [Pseudomonas amygdali pv. tabaci]